MHSVVRTRGSSTIWATRLKNGMIGSNLPLRQFKKQAKAWKKNLESVCSLATALSLLLIQVPLAADPRAVFARECARPSQSAAHAGLGAASLLSRARATPSERTRGSRTRSSVPGIRSPILFPLSPALYVSISVQAPSLVSDSPVAERSVPGEHGLEMTLDPTLVCLQNRGQQACRLASLCSSSSLQYAWRGEEEGARRGVARARARHGSSRCPRAPRDVAHVAAGWRALRRLVKM